MYQPDLLSCDFETALIKNFSAIFPKTTVGGCLFHFGQSVLRNVKENRSQRAYETDPRINRHVRTLISLAFVTADNITSAFEALEAYVDSNLEPILEYLEDNYIGRRQRQGRKPPRFAITWWNVYE